MIYLKASLTTYAEENYARAGTDVTVHGGGDNNTWG